MRIRFYSDAPLEKIEATNAGGYARIWPNDSVWVKVPIHLFRFANRVMQQHFNENYMESEKYPYAYFLGHLEKGASDTLYAQGDLEIHGVVQKRRIPVYIDKDGKFSANFKVKPADHKIKIPKIVTQKIAEEIDVYVEGKLIPAD